MCRVSIVGVSDKASVDRRGQTNRALRNQLISPSWVFLNSGVNPTVFMCGTETLCKPLQLPPSSTHPFINWYSQPYWSHEEGTRFSRRPCQYKCQKKKVESSSPIACLCAVFWIFYSFHSCILIIKWHGQSVAPYNWSRRILHYQFCCHVLLLFPVFLSSHWWNYSYDGILFDDFFLYWWNYGSWQYLFCTWQAVGGFLLGSVHRNASARTKH